MGNHFRPVVVFLGVHAQFRLVNGSVQTLPSVLPECYLHHRPVAEVDSDIFFDWANAFSTKTNYLQEGGRKFYFSMTDTLAT